MNNTYRKKPVEVEAIQFVGGDANILEIMKLMPAEGTRTIQIEDGGKALFIHTLEGKMRADMTDYIIKGVKGELYPCKADIFHATYEAAI